MVGFSKLLFEISKVLNEGGAVTSVAITETLLLHWVFHCLEICNRSLNIDALLCN